MSTYYRIQKGGQAGVDQLLDPENWWSMQMDGQTMVEGGVSAMDSIEELAEYIANSGIEFGDDPYLVEMEAIEADDDDDDANLGVCLVQPQEIITAAPVPDSFHELINTHLDD